VAYLLYRDHTIVSSAVYDDVSGKWKITARVSWEPAVTRSDSNFLKKWPELFSRSEDAEKAGLEAAKNWVESRKAVER
jgi:hypothetical protein